MGIAAMDILCCRITIGDADPSNPMRIQNGVEITEVQSLEINESYKKLIGTAKVIFPKGSVCRSTIIGNVTLEGKDVSRITTEVMQDGVIIEKRSAQRLVDETTFKVGKGSYCVCKGISTVLIPGTEIGENCVLGLRFSTVRQFPYKEVPCLKNNVWVGPNVIIAGPVVIEDDVVIAGNSFVNRSVPKGAIVAGCPAKIIGWRKNLDYAIETNPKYKDGRMPFLTK